MVHAGVADAAPLVARPPLQPGGLVGAFAPRPRLRQDVRRGHGRFVGAFADLFETFLRRLESLRQARDSSAARHAELRRHGGARPVFTAPIVPAGESTRAALHACYVGRFPPERPLSRVSRRTRPR